MSSNPLIASAKGRLERLAKQLVETPGRVASLSDAIGKTYVAVERLAAKPHGLSISEVAALQSRVLRVHDLVESALAFHCGALITNPNVEYTYTASGDLTHAVAEASLSLEG